MIACILSNIYAKYYKNPSMLSQVTAKNVGDVFLDTVYKSVTAVLFESFLPQDASEATH